MIAFLRAIMGCVPSYGCTEPTKSGRGIYSLFKYVVICEEVINEMFYENDNVFGKD